MKRMWLCGVLALLCCPLFAQAQTFKCKKANGSVSFQDQPCQAGSVGSEVNLPPVSSIAAQKSANSADSGQKRGDARQRIDETVRARNAETEAYNKSVRCNSARQQLGVLKEQRPVYRRDNKGERQYVEDANRPAEIASAERRVTEECR